MQGKRGRTDEWVCPHFSPKNSSWHIVTSFLSAPARLEAFLAILQILGHSGWYGSRCYGGWITVTAYPIRKEAKWVIEWFLPKKLKRLPLGCSGHIHDPSNWNIYLYWTKIFDSTFFPLLGNAHFPTQTNEFDRGFSVSFRSISACFVKFRRLIFHKRLLPFHICWFLHEFIW